MQYFSIPCKHPKYTYNIYKSAHELASSSTLTALEKQLEFSGIKITEELEDHISHFLNAFGGCWFITYAKGSRHTEVFLELKLAKTAIYDCHQSEFQLRNRCMLLFWNKSIASLILAFYIMWKSLSVYMCVFLHLNLLMLGQYSR